MDLTIDNPWWNTGGLWEDSDLKRVKNSSLIYHPRPFQTADCLEPAILTLRGPRRAGKTVALKLLLSELIEKQGVHPRQITWTTFDTLRTLQQAEEHLVNLSYQYKPKILFVDEVTALVGWQRVIKKLQDNGILSSTCVILTGSSAYDLKAGAERMAGRRGNAIHPDRVLLPMSFKDFAQQMERHSIKTDLIKIYLKSGGFPFRVEKFIQTHISAEKKWDVFSDFQVFDDVFFYEFNRRRLDRSIAIEVLGRLSSIGCSAMSYEGFAKPLSISRETARKYLDALGDAFLVATVSSFDTARNRVAPKKDRKFIWVDPALGYLGKWLKQAEEPEEASCAEWAVGVELLRRFEARLWEGLSAPRSVFTWKSSGGNEIDYLMVDKSKKLNFPVEVKYQNSISDWDFQVMERAFGKGLLITSREEKERPKASALSLESFLLKPLL